MKCLVNLITFSRVVAGAGIIYSVLSGYWIAAFLLVIVGELTDLVDGPIARKFGVATSDGKVLDLTADVILDLCIIGALFLVGNINLPVWLLMVAVILIIRIPMKYTFLALPIHGAGMVWFITSQYARNAIGLRNIVYLTMLVIPVALAIIYLKRERIVRDYHEFKARLA